MLIVVCCRAAARPYILTGQVFRLISSANITASNVHFEMGRSWSDTGIDSIGMR